MYKFYAQVSGPAGQEIVNGVSQLTWVEGAVMPDHLIEIDSLDADLIGNKYKGKGADGKATFEAVEVVQDAIRKITKRAFMQRFTQSERVAIRKSTDDIVEDIHEDLKATNNVDLDLTDTQNALGYLVSVAILAPQRVAEILADGAQNEV